MCSMEQCVGTSTEENVGTGSDCLVKETQESELEITNFNSAAPKRRRSSRGEFSQEASQHRTKELEEEYTANLEASLIPQHLHKWILCKLGCRVPPNGMLCFYTPRAMIQ